MLKAITIHHKPVSGSVVLVWVGVLCIVFWWVQKFHLCAPSGFKQGCYDTKSTVERLVILADTHIAGPEYRLSGENGLLDNESITKTQMRLYHAIKTVKQIMSIEPKPKAWLVIGDIVHNGLHILEEFGINENGLHTLFNMKTSGYHIASQLFKMVKDLQPIHCWGNHDNMLDCKNASRSIPKELTKQVYKHFFNAKPYDSRLLNDWKVISLNSMYGVSWDPASVHCNGWMSSYGKEQLQWLDDQLMDAKNALVITHFPPVTSMIEEVDDVYYKDLKTVLSRHKNVRLLLSGHFHKVTRWGKAGVIDSLTLPSTRYNTENVFILDLHSNGSYNFVDLDKNRNNSRCSNYFVYNQTYPDGVLAGLYQGNDSGNCGWPTVEEETTWNIDEVTSMENFPSVDEFNPSGSCRFKFAKRFFPSCLRGVQKNGDLQACCEIAEKAFWPSSSAPFSACLGSEEFWNLTAAYFESFGKDAMEIFETCTSVLNKTIISPASAHITWVSIPSDRPL